MSNPISHQPIVSHHVHKDNEPLPGARGAAPAVDYTPETIEHAKLPPSEEGDTQDLTPHRKDTPHEDTPTTTLETATQHTSSSPSGKVKLGDKIVGKTQELTGKVTRNEGLKEKGELRKQGDTL